MPFPLTLGAGLAIGQGIANMFLQGNTNVQQRNYNREMYALQRRDALADWNMMNEYNAPGAQMQRLKAAGLNPNLVYGQGAVANSSSPVRAATAQGYTPRPVQLDLPITEMIGQYQNYQVQQQQIDNLRKQKEVMDSNIRRNDADTALKALGIVPAQVRSRYAESMAAYSLDTMKANLFRTNTQTDLAIQGNDRANMIAAYGIEKTIADILYTRERTANTIVERERIREMINSLIKGNQIKDFEIQLNKRGFTRNDPYYIRAGLSLLERITGVNSYDEFKRNPFGWYRRENESGAEFIERRLKAFK